MDYKNTLNLPRTDFAMKADLVAREPQRLARWEADQIYAQIRAARAGKEKFVLHDGPPFANGDVHVGTALNKVLKDIIVKYKSLRGFDAPYIPGWDCHGLPIEFKVTQDMRKGSVAAPAANAGASPVDFSPAAIRSACDAYARKYIDLQRTQFKRLGVFGDWQNPYLTLNKEYEADELRLFADLVAQGFVYRGKKPVYWSIPCRTALAEAEVEYADHVSQSVYVKFKLAGEPNTFLLIWTTTPWTLPANLAVAFNPSLFYSRIHADGNVYLVCNSLLETVAQKCGWAGGYQIERTVSADELATLTYEHPFCARTGRLFPADFVTADTGTGFVHIAPGHGADDYHLGRSQGLPIYSPVNDEGALAHTNDLPIAEQMPAEMLGKSILEKHGRSDANDAVLHELRVRQALAHQENYHHSYPHCWRSKTPIIFRAMDQWFVKIDHQVGQASSLSSISLPSAVSSSSGTSFQTASPSPAQAASVQSEGRQDARPTFRALALAEIDRVQWIPDWGKNRIEGAVKSRPDWCISRQRSWGVPIPAFYDAQGEPILDAAIVRKAADLFEQHGSNVWFEKTAAELWTLCRPADWTGPEATAKSSDTLDVWIDSGSSSRAVLMRREQLQSRTGVPPVISNPDSAQAVSPISQKSGGTPDLHWQADVYLEGSDQHRGWFQSSLLLSLAGNGAAPFKTVLTHGFMVDEDREKISKSKQGQGGYTKPQTADRYVNEYGADVLRLWVASQDYRNDIVVSEERLKKVSETYRGIRNTLRYQLSNLYDFDPAQHTVPDAQLTGLDRWVLGEFAKLEAAVAAAYDAYEFHVVYQKLSQFAAVELSSIYHDVVKDRLYTDPANSARRRSTQTALHRMVTRLCQMLAPVLAFTADEAWEFIPGKPTPSVHLSEWEAKTFELSQHERELWDDAFLARKLILPEIEKARQTKLVGKSLESRVVFHSVTCADPTGDRNLPQILRELTNVSSLAIEADIPVRSGMGDNEMFRVEVFTAKGQKCERCWHTETTVGANVEHPTLCPRCVEAVDSLSPKEACGKPELRKNPAQIASQILRCIFCLNGKPSSDEHVIPDSIGGRIHIKEVCCECNSDLSRLVDNPFARCSLIQFARYNHSLGGKRDIVPFPFGGVGTIDTGQKVSLDESFTPHLKRDLRISKLPDGGLQIHFSADASDKDKLEQLLGEPLRKALAVEFPTWSQEKLSEEIGKLVAHARTQTPVSEHKPIRKQWSIGLDDLLFEFLKIAYEMWFRRFGYSWIENSPTAKNLRTAILNRDSHLPIRGQLFCPDVSLPISDPLKNHLILQLNGVCFIRLFDITCAVECEESEARFMLSQADSHITIQDFITGTLTEEKLPHFLAKNLPGFVP